MLSDLRAEIGPRKVLDLELVMERSAIERSRDLRQALHSNCLRLIKHSVIRTPEKIVDPPVRVIEKTIEREKLDEKRLTKLIREVISDEMQNAPDRPVDVEDQIKRAVGNSVGDLVGSIRDQINSLQINPREENTLDTPIDPRQLADLQQKSINKISENIETGGDSKTQKIRIINPNLRDLASEI